jgi:hypothetical protein
MALLKPAPGIKPRSSQTIWTQIVEEAAKQPPDVYGVEDKTQVTRGIARYATRMLTEARDDIAKTNPSARRLIIWHEQDLEMHHNIPDANGNAQSVPTGKKLDTWSTYIEVKPGGDPNVSNDNTNASQAS